MVCMVMVGFQARGRFMYIVYISVVFVNLKTWSKAHGAFKNDTF